MITLLPKNGERSIVKESKRKSWYTRKKGIRNQLQFLYRSSLSFMMDHTNELAQQIGKATHPKFEVSNSKQFPQMCGKVY